MSTTNVEYVLTMKDYMSSKLKETDKAAQGLEDNIGKIGKIAAGAFAIDKLASFGGEIVSTLGKFEKFGAVLTNTLGSNSAAQKAMSDITNFAAKTPFQVDELTGAYVKLANMGFQPTIDQMKDLGDLASSTGKGFDQLAEAVIDAQTGEFERLKEFGVRAKQQGDQVTFSFKGVNTTVANTSASIQKYILGLGEAQGVTGAMAAISATTEGQLSNLEDNFTSLKLAIGRELKPVIVGVVSVLNGMIDAAKQVGHWLKANKDMVEALAIGLAVGVTLWGAYTLIVNASTIATTAWTAAQWLLNAALTDNPIGVVIVAIGALVAGVVYAWNKFVGFRATVMGVWGTLREFGTIVADVFKGLYDIIHGVVTLSPTEIASGYAKAAGAMKDAGARMANAYKEGYATTMAGATAAAGSQPDTDTKAGDAAGKKDKAAAGPAKSISPAGASGTKVTTINISIGKLIDQFKIQTTNMTEGSGKVKELVAQTLLSALNDSQITAGI